MNCIRQSAFITCFSFLASLATAQVAASHDAALSGRLQSGEPIDAQFGRDSFEGGTFSADAGTLGDNNRDRKQQIILAFPVDAQWLALYPDASSVTFRFRLGEVHTGGGTPDRLIKVYLLDITDGTAAPWFVAAEAPLKGQALASFHGDVISTFSVDILKALKSAAKQPSATQNVIWIGLDGGHRANGEAQNVLINLNNKRYQVPELVVIGAR